MSEEKLDLILTTVLEIKEITNTFSLKKYEQEEKPKSRIFREEILRLENQILLIRAENLQDRAKIRELEARIIKLEKRFELTA